VIFFFFRHGETDWNVERRFQGHLDIELNARGRQQAREVADKLREHDLQAILSSDLSRAFETASIVVERLGLSRGSLFQDPGIKEAFLGEAQGLTVEQIREKFGENLLERWKSNHPSDADISYPGGETAVSVVKRSMETVRRFALAHPEFKRVGVATHGGVIRRVMHTILGRPELHVPIPNGVIYRVYHEAAGDPAQDIWHTPDL
jgi:broad specificity phosphatase PhoE